jgi:hypothetical protein
MLQTLNRAELIELVAKLLRAEGTQEETLEWIRLVEHNVPDPHVQNFIYWSNKYGLGDDPSAEEIVDKALSYKPIAL